MDDELTLLLTLDVQARGQEALEGVAAGLESIAAQGGLALQALAPFGDAFSGLLNSAAGLGAALAAGLAGIDWAQAGNSLSVFGALLANALLQPAALALGELGQVVQQALDGIGDQCLAAIERAADAIAATGPGRLAAATGEVLAAMDQALGEFVPEAVAQGAQIIGGLWQGIDGLAGWMAASVPVWLQTNILQPVQTFFGISGTSIVMAGVGAELVQGLMDGMSSLAGALVTATTDLITPLLPALRAFQAAFSEVGGSLIDSVQGGILAKAGEIAGAARAVVQGAIDAARSVLNGIESSIGAAQTALSGLGGSVAVGHNAMGTADWRGGLTWVGEQGPELLNLPRGAQVIPLSGASVAAGAGVLPPGTGGGAGTINVYVSGNTVMSEQDADLLASRVGQAIVRQTGLAYSLVRLMTLIVTINGTDVSALVDVQTLTITQVLTRRGDTASFALLDPSLARSFAPLQAVTIVDELGNAKFGGVATRLRKAVADGPGLNRWRLECQDATHYLQKTLCNKKYQAQSIDQIVKDLLASFPPGVTITTHNVQAGLPALQYFNAPHLRLADAFDKLVRLSDSTAFLMWDLDANYDLHFFDQNHAPGADVILTDAAPGAGEVNYRRDSFWYERDVSQFANQITFRGGTFLSNPYGQTWVGNGQQTSYLFDYPPDTSVAAGGALPVVTVSGVAQMVAIDSGNGFGSAAALLSLAQDTQSATLRFAGPPAAGATISASYVYDLPVLVRRKDNVSVTTYGTWEEYITDSLVKTQQAATQRAAAMLSQFARPLATASVDVDQTYRGSLAAGQQVTLINGQLGLNTSMLVTDCRITGMAGGRYQHRLRLAAFG